MNLPLENPRKRAASPDLEGALIDLDANQVRRRIRTFLDNSDMKVGDFQRTIDVGSTAYSRFMRQQGPNHGLQSDVYGKAWAFFKKRELGGEKIPRKKPKKAEDKKKIDVEALKGIKIDGEEDGEAEVYDTCDEVRRKIKKHLEDTGTTQAQLVRDCQALMPEDYPKITARQFAAFRDKHGPLNGSTSPVFYAGYVFFEKLRVKEGKKKTKSREKTEDAWRGKGGVSRDREGTSPLWVVKGEHVHIDQQGVTHIEGLTGHFRSNGRV